MGFKVILDELTRPPRTISLAKALQIIEQKDPKVSSDYHIMKYINRKHNEAAYKKAVEKTDQIIAMHNDCVKPNEPWLFLGDLSEGEIIDADDIRDLLALIQSLHGNPKIMVKGNNDTFTNTEVYNYMGFQYVAEKTIVSDNLKIIFSHEPIDISEKGLDKSGWINVRGHSHGTNLVYNMSPEAQLDVWYGLTQNKVLSLSRLLELYETTSVHDCKSLFKSYNWT
ncbi:MAG: metallophosphoesterase [Lachnospiraceae bacterium]|nr:metallophosphoesterase [Lachnospiraceae bacterium]